MYPVLNLYSTPLRLPVHLKLACSKPDNLFSILTPQVADLLQLFYDPRLTGLSEGGYVPRERGKGEDGGVNLEELQESEEVDSYQQA